jgi:hypothetical protein
MAIGINAGSGIISGLSNIAIGTDSYKTNPTANFNVCLGVATMRDNIDSWANTAIGFQAGLVCVHGSANTFLGSGSDFDSSGSSWYNSTCIGANSRISDNHQITLGTSSEYVLFPNQIVQTYKSNDNVAIGNKNTLSAMTIDANSRRNVAIGSDALKSLTIARNNISIGYNTMSSLTTGLQNMAIGINAGSGIISGTSNIAIGTDSYKTNNTNNYNVCVGVATMRDNIDSGGNTAIGHQAGLVCIHGNSNTFLGIGADFDSNANTWTYSTCIGANSRITDNYQITLGTSSEYLYMPNSHVKINNDIQLGTSKSTTNGSTSGTATMTMPFQGGSYKKVVIYCDSLTGTCTLTYPNAFMYTPAVLSNSSFVTSINQGNISLSGSSSNGFVILEGF